MSSILHASLPARSLRIRSPKTKTITHSRHQLTKGHTLVVPKKEVDYIFDLDDKTLAGMMLFAKEVAAKIKREIACKRVAVVALGLEVPHAHIHLIPIQSENDVDFHREKLKLTPEEFREIAEKTLRNRRLFTNLQQAVFISG